MPRTNVRSVYPRLVLSLDDGTVRHTTILTKRKISGLLTELGNKSIPIQGTAKVEYTREYNNSFDFKNEETFLKQVLPCIEKELIDEFSETR